MDITGLYAKININKKKMDRLCFRKNSCYIGEDKRVLEVLNQMKTNFTYLIYNFDKMNIDDIEIHLKKNNIKSFFNGFCYFNSRNTNAIKIKIDKKYRTELKSKMKFIYNVLWTFTNSNNLL